LYSSTIKLQTLDEWRIVFFIAAAIYIVGAVAFGFLASGEVQPWAVQSKKSKETQLKIIEE
jgi:hypothetical protein